MTHDTPSRRWHQLYHLQRLARWNGEKRRLFRAHFWQKALIGTLVFWAVVAWGIHSL